MLPDSLQPLLSHGCELLVVSKRLQMCLPLLIVSS